MALGATKYLIRMIQNLKNSECFLSHKKNILSPNHFLEVNSVFVTFHQPREITWSQWWGKVTHKIFWNRVFGISFKCTAKMFCNACSLESWIHAYLSVWNQEQALGVALVRLSLICHKSLPLRLIDVPICPDRLVNSPATPCTLTWYSIFGSFSSFYLSVHLPCAISIQL